MQAMANYQAAAWPLGDLSGVHQPVFTDFRSENKFHGRFRRSADGDQSSMERDMDSRFREAENAITKMGNFFNNIFKKMANTMTNTFRTALSFGNDLSDTVRDRSKRSVDLDDKIQQNLHEIIEGMSASAKIDGVQKYTVEGIRAYLLKRELARLQKKD